MRQRPRAVRAVALPPVVAAAVLLATRRAAAAGVTQVTDLGTNLNMHVLTLVPATTWEGLR